MPTTNWQYQTEQQRNPNDNQVGISNIDDVNECNSTLSTQDVLHFTENDYYKHIIRALENRPKQTCVFEKLPDYVLKQLGLRTRGEPREKIVAVITRALRHLETEGKVEFYKSKNKRVRLLKAGKYLFE